MSLHYIDPNDAPRECPNCNHGECWRDVDYGGDHSTEHWECGSCNGTGRLGREGAEPEIEVYFSMKGSENDGYYARTVDGRHIGSGPHPTKASALAAARKALKEQT